MRKVDTFGSLFSEAIKILLSTVKYLYCTNLGMFLQG